jgi:hypothetical protein
MLGGICAYQTSHRHATTTRLAYNQRRVVIIHSVSAPPLVVWYSRPAAISKISDSYYQLIVLLTFTPHHDQYSPVSDSLCFILVRSGIFHRLGRPQPVLAGSSICI